MWGRTDTIKDRDRSELSIKSLIKCSLTVHKNLRFCNKVWLLNKTIESATIDDSVCNYSGQQKYL